LFKDIKKLFSLLKPYKLRVFIAFLSMAMVAFFTMLISVIIQPIMDILFLKQGNNLVATTHKTGSLLFKKFIEKLVSSQNIDLAKYIPIALAFIFLGKAFFSFLSNYKMNSIGLTIIRDMRDKLYIHLLRQSIRFFSKSKTGEIISHITNDIEKVKNSVTTTVSEIVVESLTLLALLFVIFYQDWHLAIISFIIIPLAALPVKYFSFIAKKEGHRVQELIGDISTSTYELVHGIRIIKTYNMEEFEKNKFLKKSYNYFKSQLKLSLIQAASSPFMEFLGGVVAAIILTVGSHKIRAGNITPGQFMSFFTAMFLMYPPIKKLSRANTSIQQGIAGLERVESILNEKNEVDKSTGKIKLSRAKGDIKFDNVFFQYDEGNGYVLKGINIKIKNGTKIAIVGLSGSGKTSLVNLIPRFFDPTSGTIYIDGTDIKEYNLLSLRDNIGMVTQDIVLFNDTVFNNITCGEQKSIEQVKSAAKAARIDDFIESLPEKYDTLVGERGQFLSNGQRQRISIARVFLKDPPIIILDEATSALDSESESIIQKALLNLMQNRTTIIVAHRLSTIISADNILVLSNGELIEEGTHKQLLNKKGVYAHLYSLQFPERIEL